MKNVLFLCTGNYYRSRYAEILFNHIAAAGEFSWRSCSRGLAVPADLRGPISPHALKGLARLGIKLLQEPREPRILEREDLERADKVVAVKHTEHYPLMQAQFPDWADKVEYWNIHDLDCAPPEEALPELERETRALIRRLRRQLPPSPLFVSAF